MSRQARVGLLVLAGVLLFFVALFAIANRSFLFSDTFFIGSRYNNVAGLQSGAEVQYQGVNVGRVESVLLPPSPGEKIIVEMAIKESARALIRENTIAQIKSDGLVGNQIVVLVNPPITGQEYDLVEEGEFIPGEDPFNPFDIVDRMMASVAKFEQTAVAAQEVMQDVRDGEGTLGKLIYDPSIYNSAVATMTETQQLMGNLGRTAEDLVVVANDATQGLNSILLKIDEGEGTLAKMINDPAVYNSFLATADTLQAVTGDLRAITAGAENAVNWASLGAFRFSENMEALKHNWLLKRYFEERGYLEKAPFEVRERALSESYRKLQEWERQLQELEQRLNTRAAQLEAAAAEEEQETETAAAVSGTAATPEGENE